MDYVWVSIDQALPPTPKSYLVSDGILVKEARYMPRKKKWVFPSSQGGIEQSRITHWRYMPEPPSPREH